MLKVIFFRTFSKSSILTISVVVWIEILAAALVVAENHLFRRHSTINEALLYLFELIKVNFCENLKFVPNF